MKKVNSNPAIKAVADREYSKTVSIRLGVLFLIVLLAFVGLGLRVMAITRDNNDAYQQKILSQQSYDSQVIVAKRGQIVDCNGTVLAASKEKYNIILDAAQIKDADLIVSTDKSNPVTVHEDATISCLVSAFGFEESFLRQYLRDNPESRYYILKKGITYEEMSRFTVYTTVPPEERAEDSLYNENVTGVWFEKYYVRDYPQSTLACDTIGFSLSEGVASYGLEQYYNSILTGTNGRKYGYLSDETTTTLTTISAVDGDTLVATLDANVQMMVEKHLKDFALQYKNNARDGLGADNIGCIVMRANTGEVLAMASYPNFDLNNPSDLSSLYTDEEVEKMVEEGTYTDACNQMWKNYCISDTYEPGSVMKPFTVAAGLETGKLTGNETYTCNGSLTYGDYEIHCHNTYGDGTLDVKGAIAKSCNVCLMHMAEKIGTETFLQYQNIFNLGLRTNIDLAGETRTENLVFNQRTLGDTELATASFGQGFNVSMIQMCTGYAALVNGGYYYEPHVVSKILSPGGTVVKNIEPRLVKQVISNSTSDKILDYCNAVVTSGTGFRAKPAGYAIGGKTGTAETLPRGNGEYVVSFICHAPADNPEIICYVVIDRPNVAMQEDAKYATILTKEILTDILPYLNIPMTEELSEEDIEELKELDLSVLTGRLEDETGDGSADTPSPTLDLSEEAKKAEEEDTP